MRAITAPLVVVHKHAAGLGPLGWDGGRQREGALDKRRVGLRVALAQHRGYRPVGAVLRVSRKAVAVVARILVITSCAGDKAVSGPADLQLSDFQDPERLKRGERTLRDLMRPAGLMYTGQQDLYWPDGRGASELPGASVMQASVRSDRASRKGGT
jgi:hypothetical protein